MSRGATGRNDKTASDAPTVRAALSWIAGSGVDRWRRRQLASIVSQSTFPVVFLPSVKDLAAEKDDIDVSRVEVLGTAFSVHAPGVFATALHVLDRWRVTRKDGSSGLAWEANNEPLVMIPVESRPVDHSIWLRTLTATVTAIHPSPVHDLAVLITKPPADLNRHLNPLWLSEEPCMEGDLVIAAGFPFGLSIPREGVVKYYFGASFSSGIVSKVLPVAGAAPLDQSRLHLDTTINKGNSGGPLVDEVTGQVVGVITDHLTTPAVDKIKLPTGLGGAVPIIHLRAMLADVAQGRTQSIQVDGGATAPSSDA